MEKLRKVKEQPNKREHTHTHYTHTILLGINKSNMYLYLNIEIAKTIIITIPEHVMIAYYVLDFLDTMMCMCVCVCVVEL